MNLAFKGVAAEERFRSPSTRCRSLLLVVATLLTGPAAADDALIERGRQIFVAETFGGNGRTCATCHRPDNNYTVDPIYISRLSSSDPLFVAEWNPALSGLESPPLLRQVGLISVHADGYDKPVVFRAIPALVGLARTMPPSADLGRAAALGWSGDGAALGGGLREFIVNAVAEHMPRSLSRAAGVDYRVPFEDELVAIEAFLLSLGPPAEFDITQMSFTAPEVEEGKALFLSERSGSCASCHVNAGGLDTTGINNLFDIGVQHRPGGPAQHVDPAFPADGGFGTEQQTIVQGGKVGHGDARFNAPSLIEAADTAPLFHDNSAPTLESAIFYYASPFFAESPEGQKRARVELDRPDVEALGSFLRAINALENIRASDAKLSRIFGLDLVAGAELMRLASDDTEDAFRVLYGASGIYPLSIRALMDALVLQRQAALAGSVEARNALLSRSREYLNSAGAQMVRQ